MSKQLIKDRQLVDDHWQVVSLSDEATADDAAALHVPAGSVLIPAPVWLAQRDALLARSDEIAVSLAPTFAVEDLADDVQRFAMIAVEFPKFTNGRGYSTARLLRERYGFRGELRAVGNIGRDQLFYLFRVGFNAFLIPQGQNAEEALQSLNDFPEVYQGAVDQPLPLFRRRTA
ncbi:hypothetical protein PG1C_12410 [Rugosibacter aromaticivorans]|uniref:Oxidoreductase n=1 Tax=Rugosibacter aromaticivorans TaxID=1565605 RepID=A0A0C5JNW3_9PROT|nr:DUF934 domain-containing protein [Rugosibacter aromaticivorans]AJP49011.1 hypothetical protein PG1C_12410 [Rugosibacter aromaticivorans]TBR16216.1 MAG: DUF934 domain-containing protein [Rugosibacter sp.]